MSTDAVQLACRWLCSRWLVSFAIGRLGELQRRVGELEEAAHGRAGREDGCAATLRRRFKASALTRVRALTRRMRLKAFFVWYVVVGGVVRSNAIQ